MLKASDLHNEVKAIEQAAKNEKTLTAFERALLKCQTLSLKLLLNIRQNQVALMSHEGVPLREKPENVTEKE